MSSFNTNLIVTSERQRKNRFISSRFISQATIFHPASRLTPTMQSKLIEMAKGGGTAPNSPLESVHIHCEDKHYRVDLHVDYLLQPHRDILEAMLAYAATIQLNEASYSKGARLTWAQVYQAIDNKKGSKSQHDHFDSYISSDATVLSMSLSELATRIGVSPTQKNYDQIQRRITQLATTHLIIHELSHEQQSVSKRPLAFVQDYRFYYNSSHLKSGRDNENHGTNHVFLIPDKRLLQTIRDHGYCYRLDQHKIIHYTKASVRSFLKYITSYQTELLNEKTLEWALDSYLHSIASKVGHSFRNSLKKDLLENATQIEQHFNLRFQYTKLGIQIIYTGEV
ncbi:conserved hypothetical protein [Vibrio coralliirubri]|uniref:hypothetical protein n=1 Tax=Vibrio coralliirubri TaxID=1516159 RepID=UPI00063200A2|nr:hypothetical protein [Vibrio coralliirubri]CDT82691.1 conserved hypothetical protein [Vibrio coralliirubri]